MSANIEGATIENPAVKPSKPKPAAKSMVTLDIKPWGMCFPQARGESRIPSLLTEARR
jgi:hypothetical protein